MNAPVQWPYEGQLIVVNRHDGQSGLYRVDQLHYDNLPDKAPTVIGFHYRNLHWWERAWIRTKALWTATREWWAI